MKTTFRVKQPYADIFFRCAKEYKLSSPVRPERFIEKMNKNRGAIGMLTGFGMDEDGLERKNPVIVALGDSVTAGQFESLIPDNPEKFAKMFENSEELLKSGQGLPPLAIADPRECYLEKFRDKLIDLFEQTSVSVINAGIGGDNLIQMSARAERDVIRYQPDLVIINGSLNWGEEFGTTDDYKEILRELVIRIKNETDADIILLTPNGDLPNAMFASETPKETTTAERVKVIRELAEEQQVCLVDVYAIWEKAREAGCPWKELLANGANHPGVEGHEVYAIALMKLFE